MSKIYDVIRPILRQSLVHVLPSPIHAKKHIAIVGLPRSGTSWLAKSLSLAKGVSYYDDAEHELNDYRYKYLSKEQNDSYLYDHLEKELSGKIVDEMAISEQGLKELLLRPLCNTVLLKWVRLIFCLEWISQNFPDLVIVQIMRHPVPHYLSWQQRDWTIDHSLNILLNQKESLEGPLSEHSSIIKGAKTYWEKAGALWGSSVYMQLKSHKPNWYLLQHEWLCQDAEKNIRWLVEQLGLKWNDNIAEFLSPSRKRKTGPGYGKRRDPKNEIHKWHGKIKDSELEELGGIVKCFNLPFFRDMNPEDSYVLSPQKEKISPIK